VTDVSGTSPVECNETNHRLAEIEMQVAITASQAAHIRFMHATLFYMHLAHVAVVMQKKYDFADHVGAHKEARSLVTWQLACEANGFVPKYDVR
jgi:hypothetical protein